MNAVKAGAFSEKHTSRNLFVLLASIKKKKNHGNLNNQMINLEVLW